MKTYALIIFVAAVAVSYIGAELATHVSSAVKITATMLATGGK
jgi:hypothetical protein